MLYNCTFLGHAFVLKHCLKLRVYGVAVQLKDTLKMGCLRVRDLITNIISTSGRISRAMRQGNSITHGNTPLADAARSSLLPSLISRVYHLPRDCLANSLIAHSSLPPLSLLICYSAVAHHLHRP